MHFPQNTKEEENTGQSIKKQGKSQVPPI